MAILLAGILLAIVPHSTVLDDRLDVIELNRVYDADGVEHLRQLIFWDWAPGYDRFHVVAAIWHSSTVSRLSWPPRYDFSTGEYTLIFQDFDRALVRRVRSISIRETWTQYDPEQLDRATWPHEKRRGLGQ